jgi:hypothetical protein
MRSTERHPERGKGAGCWYGSLRSAQSDNACEKPAKHRPCHPERSEGAGVRHRSPQGGGA